MQTNLKKEKENVLKHYAFFQFEWIQNGYRKLPN